MNKLLILFLLTPMVCFGEFDPNKPYEVVQEFNIPDSATMKDVFRAIKEANKLGNTDDVAKLIDYIEIKYYEKERNRSTDRP